MRVIYVRSTKNTTQLIKDSVQIIKDRHCLFLQTLTPIQDSLYCQHRQGVIFRSESLEFESLISTAPFPKTKQLMVFALVMVPEHSLSKSMKKKCLESYYW